MNAVRTQIDALTTHECVMVANLMGLAEGDRILVELRAGVQREALYEGIKVGVWGGLKVRFFTKKGKPRKAWETVRSGQIIRKVWAPNALDERLWQAWQGARAARARARERREAALMMARAGDVHNFDKIESQFMAAEAQRAEAYRHLHELSRKLPAGVTLRFVLARMADHHGY